MRKYLVPVDGSNAALRAVQQAVALAKLGEAASIHVVHVHEEPLIYGEIAVYVPREKMEALQRTHSEEILAAAESALRESGVSYTRETLVGPVGQTIARHAERLGCDAIVMGRHGKTTLGDMLVGSVAMKVLHATQLPVLLVR